MVAIDWRHQDIGADAADLPVYLEMCNEHFYGFRRFWVPHPFPAKYLRKPSASILRKPSYRRPRCNRPSAPRETLLDGGAQTLRHRFTLRKKPRVGKTRRTESTPRGRCATSRDRSPSVLNRCPHFWRHACSAECANINTDFWSGCTFPAPPHAELDSSRLSGVWRCSIDLTLRMM